MFFQSRDFRSELERAGAELRALARGPGGRGFVGLPVFLVFGADARRFLDAITFAGDGDDLGMVQEPVNDGSGGGHVGKQLAPFLQRAVAGHDGGAVFVATHNDFQEVFAGVFGQLLEAHVVNDDQVGLQVFAHGALLLAERLVFEEVPHQIEDGAIEDVEVHLDGLVTDGLGQMGFADAGRADEQHVFGFADKLAAGQVKNLFFVNGGVEAPVEVLQRFEGVEVGGFGAAFHLALLADIEFVLQDEFQKLGVAQTVGGGFLKPDAQSLAQTGETEFFQGGFEAGSVHGVMELMVSVLGAKQSGTWSR